MNFLARVSLSAENALVKVATTAWRIVPKLNELITSPSAHPSWAPSPLISSAERTSPELGWPRTTDSLCPDCVREVRQKIVDGAGDIAALIHDHPGEIKAQIIERDGQILMVKKCEKHGVFEDILSTNPAFLRRIESLHPGRDFFVESPIRAHGSSSIKYGRGAVLTVDLTNRCNMVCDPCFMDANHAGFVHELEWDDITKILDESASMMPKRQMTVQFSGGEPTLHPRFLDAIQYARKLGYFAVQCATNGIRFAQDPGFAMQAKKAGLRMAYLQFDGTSNDAFDGRHVANLFDVKKRAIDNLAAAGIDVILVATITRGENNHRVGDIVRFAIDNADKVTVVSFQPVAFTGRLENISAEDRKNKRYTLSHLVYDLRDQLGFMEPMRDWFPLSAMSPFGDITDHLLASTSKWGAPHCGCHPHCGVGTILFVNKKTKQFAPLSQFLDLKGLVEDLPKITDASPPRWLAITQLAVALAKNWRPNDAPSGYSFFDLLRQFRSQTGSRGSQIGEFEDDAKNFDWRPLFVAGMHFQDLFVYDFRRTEMCVVPYGTQAGQISFCAYNTGVGWRAIVENMHQVPLREFQEKHGRHAVYGEGQNVPMPPPGESWTTADERGRRRLSVIP